MMVTISTNGLGYDIPAYQVIPFVCGIHGVLDSVDLGLDRPITAEVDPAASDRPEAMYLIEFDERHRVLAESWVMPWMRGMAIRHGIADQDLCDPTTAQRAQCIQALMVGHQFGLFIYIGFTHKRETTT